MFHYISIGFFFVVLRSSTIASTSGAFYVTGCILYVLCYLVIFGITMLVKHLGNRKQIQAEKEAYVSRFGEI